MIRDTYIWICNEFVSWRVVSRIIPDINVTGVRGDPGFYPGIMCIIILYTDLIKHFIFSHGVRGRHFIVCLVSSMAFLNLSICWFVMR